MLPGGMSSCQEVISSIGIRDRKTIAHRERRSVQWETTVIWNFSFDIEWVVKLREEAH